MAQNESPKPSAHSQQQESQGKEKSTNLKGNKENRLVEKVTITKVEG